MSIQKINFSKY